jgi:hypothetical protein
VIFVSTISATIDIGSDSADVSRGLLSRFPEGRRIHLVLADEKDISPISKADLVNWLKACSEKGWFSAIDQVEKVAGLKGISLY